jgi:hypothetical protein
VVFAKPDPGDRIMAVARNSERTLVEDELSGGEESPDENGELSTSNGGASGVNMASDQGVPPLDAGGGGDESE